MINYKVPTDINKEAKTYMNDVLSKLDESGVLENVDNAALDMLARNYSMFINASKQVEKDLISENQRLRAENAHLKNLQALVLENERHLQKKRR